MNTEASDKRYNKSGRIYLSAKRKKKGGNLRLNKRNKLCDSNVDNNYTTNSDVEAVNSRIANEIVVPCNENYDSDLSISDRNTLVKNDTSNEFPVGRRIFDIEFLFQQLKTFGIHKPFGCNFTNMSFIKEIQKGMNSLFFFKCNMCGITEKICTEKNDTLENKVIDMNTAAVSAAVSIGIGYTQYSEQCAAQNMPCFSKKTFRKYQNKVASTISDVALETMLEAGKEEHKLALKFGEVDKDGIPCITVVVDGAWAKRSYKTNYNSLSGVACIVGYRTKKVLFTAVRNKYCCICAKYDRDKISKENRREHTCNKNWDSSSTAMEADIILEGFKNSMAMHGIKYTKLIGDGDSSVMDRLFKCMPYGNEIIVQKISCTNHILRNYRNRLRDMSKKHRSDIRDIPPHLRKTIDSNIIRLTSALTGAIRFRSKQTEFSYSEQIINLKNDFKNSPYHVFGDHSLCETYFCDKKLSTVSNNEENLVPALKSSGLWNDLLSALNIVINQTDSLIFNVNNNLAEHFNSIVVKFVGGKRINFCLGGSYEMRCKYAVTHVNSNYELHTKINKALKMRSPGKYTTNFEKLKRNQIEKRRHCRRPKSRKKLIFQTSKPDEHYCTGLIEEDMSEDDYNMKKEYFLNQLFKNEKDRTILFEETKIQHQSELWKQERRKRLTASSFGQICKSKTISSKSNIVINKLYKPFKGNIATNYGVEKEIVAKNEFEEKSGLLVSDSGMFIDETFPFLAATPDGLIGDRGLLEIKCPYSAKQMSPADAVMKKLITYCTIDENMNLILKTNHNYFYQIQGQLHITRRDYCLFVVWTPHGCSIEKINRDDGFWREKMEKNLVNFYDVIFLPELIDSRYLKNRPLRGLEK